MKHLFPLLLLVGIMVYACKHQPKQNESTAPTPEFKREFKNKIIAGPNDSTTIEWLDPVFQNLGVAKRGPGMDITYNFKNTGDKPLIIDSVDAGCGCTLFDVPAEPIAPGAKGKIRVRYETDMQGLSINIKHVDIIANTRPQPFMRLGFQVKLVE